ncbi:hypothetical protein NVV94_16340 [Pseudomonas sp. LS1212]|uniref:hypothetical protein n=1 Tax=Pseudomonas sp. LS1212 TaxID=2972478 RepID=UPI00215D4F59|nr:hypothetical protein [Pseudomonas sp. LS1212]UVJ42212.1 hypothetical protein NVV94_16340 [Pseudomonas sp. LS1212]
MKVIVQGDIIKITGGNFLFSLFTVIMLISVTPIGLFLSLVLLMSEEGIFIKIIACWMSITLPPMIILLGRNALRARTACTLINNGEQSVIIEDKASKDIYNIGDFKALIVQLVNIPKASHYQAYLVGVSGKCPLGIQSMSRNKLTRIFKPISEKLGIPLEYAEQAIGFSEAIAIRESSVKS